MVSRIYKTFNENGATIIKLIIGGNEGHIEQFNNKLGPLIEPY